MNYNEHDPVTEHELRLERRIEFLEKQLAEITQDQQLLIPVDHVRWVCPQCFTSIRERVVVHKEKPAQNCPDHWRLEHVKTYF